MMIDISNFIAQTASIARVKLTKQDQKVGLRRSPNTATLKI
jgi:hypothetical protein